MSVKLSISVDLHQYVAINQRLFYVLASYYNIWLSGFIKINDSVLNETPLIIKSL